MILRDINNFMTKALVDKLVDTQKKYSDKLFVKFNDLHDRKLQNIVKDNHTNDYNNTQKNMVDSVNDVSYKRKWFYNSTDVSIPVDVIEVMSLDHKFNLEHKFSKANSIETIRKTEYLLNIGEFNDQFKNYVQVDIIAAVLTYSEGKKKHVKREEKIFKSRLKYFHVIKLLFLLWLIKAM